MYSQIAQPAYPIKRSSTIDFTMKESQKDKMVREDGLDKLAWIFIDLNCLRLK
jgi:predicted GNAT superfamily acetyltransferase